LESENTIQKLLREEKNLPETSVKKMTGTVLILVTGPGSEIIPCCV
jgi:hypothetical protein